MTEQTLKEIERNLKKIIIGFYEPEFNRWNRNYSDRAEWYLLWRKELEI